VLVGEDLRVVFLNSAGRDLIAAGSAIFCRRGYLRVRPTAVEAALAVAVRGAADDEAAIGRRGFGIRATSAGTPHILHVLPLRRGGIRPRLIPGAAAAILIAPTVQKAPCQADVLAALYNLTPAEARVFVQVAAGMTRAEAAGVLGVGPNTVKAHLAEIFAKTGTRRQADLVALAAAITLPLRQ
jgi:DNA-binding CsgD family transcriptional regulator